jgi:hypothetical protein
VKEKISSSLLVQKISARAQLILKDEYAADQE